MVERYKKINELVKVFTDGNWIESKDQSEFGIRLIQTGNIGAGVYKERNEKARFISQKTFEDLKCFEIFAGDILVSRLPEPVGRACILPDYLSQTMITSVDCSVVRFNNEIEPQYFIYFSQSDEYLRDVEGRTSGTTRKRISRKNLGLVKVPLPPLPEQHRIVKILDEAFADIAKAKEIADRNRKNSNELFESYQRDLFVNRKDWPQKALGDVCKLYQGIAINAKTKHSLVSFSILPLLRIKDLKNNSVEQYIDPENYPKNALVNESDIIYTRTGQIGLVFTGKKGVLHNNSFKIVPDSSINKEFFCYWLQNPTFKSKITRLASRAAQPDITHALFKQQFINIPSLSEQNTIVSRLDALSSETQKLEVLYSQKLLLLEELKKSILKKAFAGEL